MCGCGVDYSIKTKVNVGWHGDTRHRLHYTAWHMDSNITASYPNEDVSMSLPFVTLGTTGGLAVIGPVVLRLDTWFIEKNYAVHMCSFELAPPVNWSRDRAVHMYSLEQVQLVSRPWDRGKTKPGNLLSTDTGNIVKQWDDLANRILTIGCSSKNSIMSQSSRVKYMGPKTLLHSPHTFCIEIVRGLFRSVIFLYYLISLYHLLSRSTTIWDLVKDGHNFLNLLWQLTLSVLFEVKLNPNTG